MLKRILDNAIALFVVVVVMFLFIPLRPEILDILLVINIGLSVMILMITMNISDALEFSIFPSLLLITTLFRLGMNVSSTRMILTTGYPGEVIENFGRLVTQGDIVVGFVIFFIIVLAKGQDNVAMRIVEIAEENKIAVVENVPLARALYAQTELNQFIPPDLYGPVAEVLVYIFRLNEKKQIVK